MKPVAQFNSRRRTAWTASVGRLETPKWLRAMHPSAATYHSLQATPELMLRTPRLPSVDLLCVCRLPTQGSLKLLTESTGDVGIATGDNSGAKCKCSDRSGRKHVCASCVWSCWRCCWRWRGSRSWSWDVPSRFPVDVPRPAVATAKSRQQRATFVEHGGFGPAEGVEGERYR